MPIVFLSNIFILCIFFLPSVLARTSHSKLNASGTFTLFPDNEGTLEHFKFTCPLQTYMLLSYVLVFPFQAVSSASSALLF